jgi:site-specific DNA recombinase
MVKEGDTIGHMDTQRGAVTYSRVSSADQVDGFSLDVQRRETRKAAEKLGCRVLKEFVEEGVSGTLEDRPSLTALLAFCVQRRGEVQHVIVKDIDRFSRDTLVHQILKSKLKALGISLYSINQPSISEDSPHARFMENIFSSVAQLERDQIVQRCESGTKEAVRRGAWTTRAPYGYQNEKSVDGIATLGIIPERAEAVRKAFQLYAEGTLLQDIANRLQALGYVPGNGGKFSKQTAYNILRNPV